MKFTRVTAAALLALSFGSAAQASTNFVNNGSFEDLTGTTLASGSYCYLGTNCGVVPSWTGQFPLMLSNSSPWGNPNTPFGDVLIGIQGGSNADQSLTLSAGSYTLAWSDAGRTNQGNAPETYQVTFNGGAALDTQTVLNGSGAASWQSHSLTFSASGNGVLSFQGLTSTDSTAFIDNVSVTAVPEPETYVMLLAGLGLLGFTARRSRKV